MIDIHSHILPKMDDGSRSVQESLSLLRASAAQGITCMIATPHFYAEENTPRRFLARRQAAWDRLEPYLTDEMPEIRLGAEVHYFEGISCTEDTLLLRTEGTRVLLLEMPFKRWNDRMLEEVLQLSRNPEIRIVMAHIERYLSDQRSGVLERLLENGIAIQSNAEYFLRWPENRRAVRMLRDHQIHLLASDCHNTEKRPPRIGEALRVIEKKLGPDAVFRLRENSRRLLDERDIIQ